MPNTFVGTKSLGGDSVFADFEYLSDEFIEGRERIENIRRLEREIEELKEALNK